MAGKKVGNWRPGTINFNLGDIAFFNVKILKTFWRNSNGQTIAGFDDFSDYHLRIGKIIGIAQK